MNDIQKDILSIKKLKSEHGLFICPTDTVWGISALISNRSAVSRINEIKSRSPNQSFILLVDSIKMLKRYVLNIPEPYFPLIKDKAIPRSFVFKASDFVPDYLKAKDQSIAIRICANRLIQQINSNFNQAIISTSANFGGAATPFNYQQIDKDLFKQVDYVCKYGQRSLEHRAKSSPLITINADNNLVYLRK